MRRGLASLTILALVLLLAGCGAPSRPPTHAAPVKPLVWPAPPAEPRIRYVRSITNPSDIGAAKPFLQRLVEIFTGKTDEYLIRPIGVAERGGMLYIADPGAQALWIFDLRQQHSIKITQAGDQALVSPVAVAAREDGAVFVADSWLSKVFLWDRHGKFLRTFIENGLDRPAGLAYDQTAGQLYVADSAGQQIAVYDHEGMKILAWGKRGNKDGEFNFPTHLWLDRSGTMLVTDALNYRVQAFDRQGKFLWKIGRHGDGSGDFAAPKGVATDSQGHLYVSDALFDAVQIFEPNGTFLLGFGERGTAPGQFWLPGGLFIDSQDRIYVADSYNQRIQVFEFLHGPP